MSDEGAGLFAKGGAPIPIANALREAGVPEELVDVYFGSPDPSWKPLMISPEEHLCGWDGALGPFQEAAYVDVPNTPADQVADILHRVAAEAEVAWAACTELMEAGEAIDRHES